VLGTTLGGKYLLLRLIGAGGMGEVYEARNQNTGRRVAVKVLLPDMARDHAVVERFLREARTATRIRHPNVVDILDLDVDASDGTPFIVLEFLLGESLDAWLEAQPNQRMPVGAAMIILAPGRAAVAISQRQRIVHRDLKPGNIFLTRGSDGRFVPKVIDFGIARVDASHPGERFRTQTGVAIGTPAYMSPEQAAGDADVDAQTDVWALGVMFYEMIVGRLPYEAPNVNLLIGKILYEPPTPITAYDRTLSPDVVDLLERAVCRDRAVRFPSAVEMLEAAAACDWREEATTVMPQHRASHDDATRPVFDVSTRPSAEPATRPDLDPATRPYNAPRQPAEGLATPSLVGWETQGNPAPTRRSKAPLLAMATITAVLGIVATVLTFGPWPRRRSVPVHTVSREVGPTSPTPHQTVAPPPPTAAPPVPEPAVVAPAVVAPTVVAAPLRAAATAPTPRRVVPRTPQAVSRPRPTTPLFDNAYP